MLLQLHHRHKDLLLFIIQYWYAFWNAITLLFLLVSLLFLWYLYLQLILFAVGNCLLCQRWSRKRARSNAGAVILFLVYSLERKIGFIMLELNWICMYLHSTWREENASMTRRSLWISTRYKCKANILTYFSSFFFSSLICSCWTSLFRMEILWNQLWRMS